MAGNILLNYGSSGQAITCTLASLANAAARGAAAVDNSSNLYEDALVQVKVTTATSGVSATGYVNVYVAASVDGGSTWADNDVGTDAAVTLVVPPNLKLLGSFNAVANNTAYASDAMSVAAAFGGTMPQKWALVIQNQTGASLAATGNLVQYQGVYHSYT